MIWNQKQKQNKKNQNLMITCSLLNKKFTLPLVLSNKDC